MKCWKWLLAQWYLQGCVVGAFGCVAPGVTLTRTKIEPSDYFQDWISKSRTCAGLPDKHLTNLETFCFLKQSFFKLKLSDVSVLWLEDDSVKRVKRKKSDVWTKQLQKKSCSPSLPLSRSVSSGCWALFSSEANVEDDFCGNTETKPLLKFSTVYINKPVI